MYSAQITGASFQPEDFIEEGYMVEKLLEAIAKEIVQKQQHWDYIEQPGYEDVTVEDACGPPRPVHLQAPEG